MNEPESHPEALDLRAYLRPVWRRKWIVLAIVVIATAATYFISARQPKTYVSSATLYVQTADPTQNITGTGPNNAPSSLSVANVAQLLLSQADTSAVAQQLGRPVASAGSVVATPSSGSDFVTVTATSRSGVVAARLANAYVSVFLRSRAQEVRAEARRDERATRTTLKGIPKSAANTIAFNQRQNLLQTLETYEQIALNPSPGAQQVDKAVAPHLPASPKPKRDAIFGGVVGLILGILAAFGLELLDRRLERVASVESIFGRPVLAVLPHVADPTPIGDGEGRTVPPQFLEELRSLVVMLRLSGDTEPPRTIMVTSALPREGKSTVTRDLALVYAETGQRVLVIDGDLRRPSMARLFGIDGDRGLVQILRGEATLADAAVAVVKTSDEPGVSSNGHGPPSPDAAGDGHGPVQAKDGRGSVDVIAHGERLDSPLELMSSERMIRLLEDAYESYDIVLMDTPPVLTVADSVPLLEVFDSVLLVARLGQTTRHAADRFNELINRLSNVTFSGVIANDQQSQPDDGYGSYGRYGYGYSDGKEGRRKQKQKQKDGVTVP